MTTPTQTVANADGLHDERKAALRQLAPELFSGDDGEIDAEALLAYFNAGRDARTREAFNFTWVGKRDAIVAAGLPPTGTLVPEHSTAGDYVSSQNLIIEGDNLEVLRILRKSYAGKIKLIYIDPPYNTGNDFVYPDNYAEPVAEYLRRSGAIDGDGVQLTANTRADGRFHAKWLTMMYPRLVLARELLRDDGVIFVSIDDNEVHHLRAIMNEIFGEENFVAEITVGLNPKGRQITQFFATSHEYLIVYGKNVDITKLDPSTVDGVDINDFPENDEYGRRYRALPLRNTNSKFNPNTRPNLYFPIYVDRSGRIAIEHFEGSVSVFPVFGTGQPAVWRWSKPKVNEDLNQLVVREVRGTNGIRLDVYQKDYYSTDRKMKIKTHWESTFCGSTDIAVDELKNLFNSAVFTSPKPTKLIRKIVCMLPTDSIVLDFFAGSGTTAHAVMAQNAADGGNRKFILVQFPEPLNPANSKQKMAAEFCDSIGKPRTIAEITKERVRRAAARIRAEHPMFAGDVGFASFKLASSHIVPLAAETHATVQSARMAMFGDRLVAGWHVDALASELLLREGFPLTATWQHVVPGWRLYAAPDIAFPLLMNLDDAIVDVAALVAYLVNQGWVGVNKRHGVAICRDSAIESAQRMILAEYVTVKTL